jgi:hypothetical protein
MAGREITKVAVPTRREVVFTKTEASTNLLGNRENRLSMWAIQAAPVVRATPALPVTHLVRVTKTRMAKGVRWVLLRAVPGTLAIEVEASAVARGTRAATVTETCPTIEVETRPAIEVEILVAIMADTPRVITAP